MALDFADIIGIIYISFQGVVTLFISILGVIFVRRQFILEKNKINEMEMQIQTHNVAKTEQNEENDEKELENLQNDKKIDENKLEPDQQEQIKTISKMSLIKLWFQTVWKMRSVYTSFAVHVFDQLTDILVILEWWDLEKNGNDIKGINSRIMAICGLTVLLFHRFITSLAFWVKEKNILRCILQLFDFLVFEEIFICHKRIITQFRNQSETKSEDKKDVKNDAVDTTMSFKFVRNLEAIFESIPQAILQIVFIMRTSSFSQYNSITLLIISIISIIQSIISMTNSILKNDNTFMNVPKFKKHKQRLPPTIPFLKHLLGRLSEVISRIGFFALFWTVCGGLAFGILLGAELFIILALVIYGEVVDRYSGYEDLNAEGIFLRIQGLIVLPSELIYAVDATMHRTLKCAMDGLREMLISSCLTCCLCYWPSVLLSTWCRCRVGQYYAHPGLRIGASMVEWIILILWALIIDNTRFQYLFSPQHGLYVFVISIICFFIYTQYLSLFPHFALPRGISVRSRFGYAFNGELEELQRIKPRVPMTVKHKTYSVKSSNEYVKIDNQEVNITTEGQFWDLNYENAVDHIDLCTPAVFAMANNHQHIVKWLEQKKAVKHKLLMKQFPPEKDKDVWDTGHWTINTIYARIKKINNSNQIDKHVAIARALIDKDGDYFRQLTP